MVLRLMLSRSARVIRRSSRVTGRPRRPFPTRITSGFSTGSERPRARMARHYSTQEALDIIMHSDCEDGSSSSSVDSEADTEEASESTEDASEFAAPAANVGNSYARTTVCPFAAPARPELDSHSKTHSVHSMFIFLGVHQQLGGGQRGVPGREGYDTFTPAGEEPFGIHGTFEVLLLGEAQADLVPVASGAFAVLGESGTETGNTATLNTEVTRGTVPCRTEEHRER
ncbi:hypothetical protein F7725_001432, partial [Dissostichus mawsoni]